MVRDEFTLRDPLDAQSSAALARIESAPSAFIHVRRGDYVNNADPSKNIGTCPEDYYREAVTLLRGKGRPRLALLCVFRRPGLGPRNEDRR